MNAADTRTVRLDIASRIEMLEMVQVLAGHLSALAGFDEDTTHYMSVAIRESVVNAIKHGNGLDETKRVTIEVVLGPGAMEIHVQDEGKGFDPAAVPDPVAEENLLKAYGRGIFFMRQFMDEVRFTFPKSGGTRVTLVKRLP
jgi:serine/threonine-protein kinase RsbW